MEKPPHLFSRAPCVLCALGFAHSFIQQRCTEGPHCASTMLGTWGCALSRQFRSWSFWSVQARGPTVWNKLQKEELVQSPVNSGYSGVDRARVLNELLHPEQQPTPHLPHSDHRREGGGRQERRRVQISVQTLSPERTAWRGYLRLSFPRSQVKSNIYTSNGPTI